MDWTTLPIALLKRIFSFLNCVDLTSAVSTNSTWNSLNNNDDIWKEAIFNESFPCGYSYSQQDVPWRQIVQRHFKSKRNIIKRRCVQYTLGVECPTSNPRGDIRLRWQSVGGKYCLIVWEIADRSQTPSTRKYLATELWNLETRTIVQNYPFEMVTLKLFGDYIIEINNEYEAYYAKLDPSKAKLDLKNKIPLQNVTYETLIRNEDNSSSLIALTGHTKEPIKQKFVTVMDLRTGTKILEKSYEYDSDHYMAIDELHGDKLVMHDLYAGNVIVLDVLQDKEISLIESQISCVTLAGDELWIASAKRKCLIKYNLVSMKRQEYECSEIKSTYKMKIFDGIIWLYSYPKMFLIGVSATKCQVLTWISLRDPEAPEITQLPNGVLTLTNESYAHIISFRDEDVELPISVLQIEPSLPRYESKILSIKQGDLNKTIAEHFSDDVTSEIVYEDKSNRLILVYGYSINNEFNTIAYKLKKTKYKNQPEAYHHKTAVFQLAHFDYPKDCVHYPFEPSPELIAYGKCWILYEKKVGGGWKSTSPSDDWKAIKARLGLD